MVKTTRIAIDLDVHRAIENSRTSFDQSHNAILREILDLPSSPPEMVPPDRGRRRTGTYEFVLLGDKFEAASLKEAYTSCLRKLAERDPGFLERLSRLDTGRRRIVATKPADLYLRRPDLAEKHARRLTGRWWIDTNLSRPQCERRLRMACEAAGLQFGGDDGDLILEFPNGKASAPGLKGLLAAAPLEGIDNERPRGPGHEIDL